MRAGTSKKYPVSGSRGKFDGGNPVLLFTFSCSFIGLSPIIKYYYTNVSFILFYLITLRAFCQFYGLTKDFSSKFKAEKTVNRTANWLYVKYVV